MSEPAWHPDPSGRHQYRWWDGAAWTESVSDNGVVGSDPVSAAPQAASTPQVSSPQATIIASATPQVPVSSAPPANAPASGAPFGGQSFPPSSGTDFGAAIQSTSAPKSSPLKWIIPVVIVVAVAVGLFLVLGGGDDDGGGAYGVIEGELEDNDSVVPYEYQLKRGDVLRVRIEPDSGLDAIALVLVDRSTARAVGAELEERFSDDGFTDADDVFSDAEDVASDADLGELDRHVEYATIDDGFEGEPDADYIPAFVDGTYIIAVTSYDNETSGKFRMIVEKFNERVPLDDVDSFSDLDEFFSDNDDFFSDDDFFSNDDEYEPES